ncbi:MAG: dephospho-CoA kinase [Bdellovibrionales bacterium]|nr:dephospho-CoA kinase [Bdellovibrionales bacterium]
MKWIGITGGIGSGKSVVSNYIRSKNFAVVDADHLAREALLPGSECVRQVTQAFGQKFLNHKGEIDRSALGSLVFSDPKAMSILEGIIHPYVRKRAQEERQRLQKSGTPLAFYDVPLLFEKRMEKDFDAVIVVDCDLRTRIERLQKRDRLPMKAIEDRIASQHPLEEKVQKASYVLNNNKDIKHLYNQIETLLLSLSS